MWLAVHSDDDADTVGAITGQLAGALYGVGSVSAVRIEILRESHTIAARAGALFSRLRKRVQI